MQKVIGPLRPGELFVEDDFSLLEKYMMSSSTGKIEKKIKVIEIEPDRLCYVAVVFLFCIDRQSNLDYSQNLNRMNKLDYS